MGEANRRGTLDQRIQAASEQSDAIHKWQKHLRENGNPPHYAFIFDRSEKGLKTINELKRGTSEMKARVNSAAFELWEKSKFQFIVIWGSFGYSGGLTIPTLDMKNLITQTLPAIMDRNNGSSSIAL